MRTCSICKSPYTGVFGLGPCVNGHTIMEEAYGMDDATGYRESGMAGGGDGIGGNSRGSSGEMVQSS